MALIDCNECGSKVSTYAASCPKCGAPVTTADQPAGVALTTMQETGKRLKVHVLIALFLMVGGIVFVFSSEPSSSGDSTTVGIGVSAFMLGLLWYIVTKVRIWWHHK